MSVPDPRRWVSWTVRVHEELPSGTGGTPTIIEASGSTPEDAVRNAKRKLNKQIEAAVEFAKLLGPDQ